MIAPPPIIYAAAGVAAWGLHQVLPIKIATQNLEIPGYVVLGLGGSLALWALAIMRKSETSPNPSKPTQALVTTGPFRFSRNPLYLGMMFLFIGLGLVLNTLWVAALFPVLLVVMLFGVIFREERYLLLRFGGKYLKYKVSVRRWL